MCALCNVPYAELKIERIEVVEDQVVVAVLASDNENREHGGCLTSHEEQ